MLAAAALATAPAAAAEPVILGQGEYRYRVVEGWGALPPGFTYRDGAAVCVDSKDNVYVFNRGAHPVIVFDRDGNFLRSWGEDIGFVNAHGAATGPDSPSLEPGAVLDIRRRLAITCIPTISPMRAWPGVRARTMEK